MRPSIRSLLAGTLALLALDAAGARAQTADGIEPRQEMAFALVPDDREEGPARFALLGRGRIAARTPSRFKAAARSLPPGSVIYLDSTGGSLLPALALGAAIRDRALTTVVPGGARCTSACAYAFLGGTTRMVDPDGSLGLHRPFLANRLTGAQVPRHEGIDVDEMDELLKGYVAAMKVDPRIVTLAQGIAPSEMWYPDQAALQDLLVTTAH